MADLPVFVSSTFKDFHRERDLLAGPIRDRLNELLRPNGFEIQLIDLRWGINTSETSDEMRRVLDVCLDEVARTQPLFLGMVGSRHGALPDDLQREYSLRRLGLELPDGAQPSVTELEFGAAGLWNEDADSDPVLLFRELVGTVPAGWQDDDPADLADFKSRIAQRWGQGAIVTYAVDTARDPDLEHIVVGNEEARFVDLLVDLLTPRLLHRVRMSHSGDGDAATLYRDQRGSAVGTEGFADVLCDRLLSKDALMLRHTSTYLRGRPGVVIDGPGGSGNTTVLLAVERHLRRRGYRVGSTLIGIDADITTAFQLARRITGLLAEAGGGVTPLAETVTWAQDFRSRLETWTGSNHQPIVLTFDNAWRVGNDPRAMEIIVSAAVRGIPVLVAAATAAQKRYLNCRGFQRFQIGALSPDEIPSVLRGWEQRSRKRLPTTVEDKFGATSRSPIWLALACEMVGDLTAADFTTVAEAPRPGDAIEQLLARRADDLPHDDGAIAARFLEHALAATRNPKSEELCGLLAVSRHGLTPLELHDLLGEAADADDRDLTVATLLRRLGSQLATTGPQHRFTFAQRPLAEAAAALAPDDSHERLLGLFATTPLPPTSAERDARDHDILWHAIMSEQLPPESVRAVQESLRRLGSAAGPVMCTAMREKRGVGALGQIPAHMLGVEHVELFLEIMAEFEMDALPAKTSLAALCNAALVALPADDPRVAAAWSRFLTAVAPWYPNDALSILDRAVERAEQLPEAWSARSALQIAAMVKRAVFLIDRDPFGQHPQTLVEAQNLYQDAYALSHRVRPDSMFGMEARCHGIHAAIGLANLQIAQGDDRGAYASFCRLDDAAGVLEQTLGASDFLTETRQLLREKLIRSLTDQIGDLIGAAPAEEVRAVYDRARQLNLVRLQTDSIVASQKPFVYQYSRNYIEDCRQFSRLAARCSDVPSALDFALEALEAAVELIDRDASEDENWRHLYNASHNIAALLRADAPVRAAASLLGADESVHSSFVEHCARALGLIPQGPTLRFTRGNVHQETSPRMALPYVRDGLLGYCLAASDRSAGHERRRNAATFSLLLQSDLALLEAGTAMDDLAPFLGKDLELAHHQLHLEGNVKALRQLAHICLTRAERLPAGNDRDTLRRLVAQHLRVHG